MTGSRKEPFRMLARSKKRGGQESRGSKGVPVIANGSSAEAAVTSGEPGEEEAVPLGQRVELKFRAPRAGKYDLTLFCISGAGACLAQSPPLHMGHAPLRCTHPAIYPLRACQWALND